MAYALGAEIAGEHDFTDEDDEPATPGTVVVQLIAPDGSSTWPTPTIDGSSVTWRSGALTQRGRWRWRISSTGLLVGADHGFVDVEDVLHAA